MHVEFVLHFSPLRQLVNPLSWIPRSGKLFLFKLKWRIQDTNLLIILFNIVLCHTIIRCRVYIFTHLSNIISIQKYILIKTPTEVTVSLKVSSSILFTTYTMRSEAYM